MDTAVAFGKALRCLRKQKAMTQEELADLSGYQRNYVSLLELGRNQPTLTAILALSKALECSPLLLLKNTLELIDGPNLSE
ncbi:helix-turn-helix transcriptional regulator [Pseudomonas savastanoi pv. phaseolicola]|uniref:helix-turn-helix domain-containing protein n=1 Tax=Pseudomonas syringae group genomosp. 2 TaxID=251698 RepID=UPI0009B61958|nr:MULTISPECIES: helix-turn-helix transcriptional regulator [Pseudomonas syringae group genomosp. 2]MBN3472021.1 helix-turn-helix transcriptional regulator [Pseudomonas savastanoi pv. phaseolicola]MBN3479043.1 helix-turn-helix transcriptional regulator [Pseudomonas savastanoi pv. phaseolicola]